MDFAQVLGWIATFLFSVMVIPQMAKTLKSRDTKGVSLLLFIRYGKEYCENNDYNISYSKCNCFSLCNSYC